MKKIFLTSVLLLFFSKEVAAQSLYIDPTTTAALMLYSSQLRKEQRKTQEEVKGLKKVQATVGVAMAEVGRVQDKVYKGLSEVSETLKNAHQVKEIYHNLTVSAQYIQEIKNIAIKHPQYSVFAVKGVKVANERITTAGLDIVNILKDGELNLMTAGDRYKLLFKIEHETRMIRVYLLGILMPMQRAEQIGFWKAINPFQGYIDTDKSIIENILSKNGWSKI